MERNEWTPKVFRSYNYQSLVSWLVLWKDIGVIPQDWGQRKRYGVDDECCLGCAPFDMSLEHLRGSIRRVGRVALRGSTWRGKAGRSLHHTQGD